MANIQSINVVKRPWYEWVLWAAWFLVEIFVAQNAIASSSELEPRAASIFWMTFGVLLLAGVIVWFIRRAALTK